MASIEVKLVSLAKYERLFPREDQFFKLTKEHIMKAMRDAVLTVAKRLAKANNTVTTLEIKTELRRDYPYYFWDQNTVSSYMSQFATDSIFTYKDNGSYRVYSLSTPAQVAQTAGPVSKQMSKSTIGGAVLGNTATPRRGRPRKNSLLTVIDHAFAFKMAGYKDFESVTFNTGIVVDRAGIRAQKKSPQGYLTPTKLQKVVKITVSGTTFDVK